MKCGDAARADTALVKSLYERSGQISRNLRAQDAASSSESQESVESHACQQPHELCHCRLP